MHNLALSGWANPQTLTPFITALVALVGAIGGIIASMKNNKKVETEVKPKVSEIDSVVHNDIAPRVAANSAAIQQLKHEDLW